MKAVKLRRLLSSLFLAATGALLLGFVSPANAGNGLPASDLTVTVRELADGQVQFCVSGTAYMKGGESSFYETEYNWETSSPPHNRVDGFGNPSYDWVSIPEGLHLMVPEWETPQDELQLYGLQPSMRRLDMEYVAFSSGGYWRLGSFWSGYLEYGDPITGHGCVTTAAIPFSDFVPGTFPIDGQYFDMTYVVIPYVATPEKPPRQPRLRTPRSRRFGTLEVGRSSRVQRIPVTNEGGPAATPPPPPPPSSPPPPQPKASNKASSGGGAATGLRVRVSGRGARHFRVSQTAAKTLALGESTFFTASFRPRSPGNHRAVARILSSAPTETTFLRGRGIRSRVNSPRFPRAF